MLYTPAPPPPTPEEAAYWGLTVEEASERPPFEIWPDNLQTVNVFLAMGTQWRVGMAGATGLDYGVLPAVMALSEVPEADRPEVFEGIRVMEQAAVKEMRKQK